MTIKQYIHGEADSPELFAMMGEWAMSKEVHQALGIAITSEIGDVWFIAFDDDTARAVGFAQVRPMKNNHAHLRYVYAPTRKEREQLISAILSMVSRTEYDLIYTYDREDAAPQWEKLRFKLVTTHKRGSFRRFERNLA